MDTYKLSNHEQKIADQCYEILKALDYSEQVEILTFLGKQFDIHVEAIPCKLTREELEQILNRPPIQ